MPEAREQPREDEPSTREALSQQQPLNAQVEPWAGGWVVRLVPRREAVRVEKAVIVREEVLVGRATVQEVTRLSGTVKRERLNFPVSQR